MDLSSSRVQFLRASTPVRHRDNGVNFIKKLAPTGSHKKPAPVFGQKLDDADPSVFLPRSSSFESQPLGPQPQMIEIKALSYSIGNAAAADNTNDSNASSQHRQHSAVLAGSGAAALSTVTTHAAVTVNNNGVVKISNNSEVTSDHANGVAEGRGGAGDVLRGVGEDPCNTHVDAAIGGRQQYLQAPQQTVNRGHSGRPRPSSATDGGVGGGQISYFPLLAADEDSDHRYYLRQRPHQPHHHHYTYDISTAPRYTPKPSNNVSSSVSGATGYLYQGHSSSSRGGSAKSFRHPVKVAATLTTNGSRPNGTMNNTSPSPGVVSAATTTSNAHFVTKPMMQKRERGVGQPLRAHPTNATAASGGVIHSNGNNASSGGGSSSSTVLNGKIDPSAGGSSPTPNGTLVDGSGGRTLGVGTKMAGAGEGSGAAASPFVMGGRKPFAPRCLALATDAGTRLIVGQTPPALSSLSHTQHHDSNPISTRGGAGVAGGAQSTAQVSREVAHRPPGTNNAANFAPKVSAPGPGGISDNARGWRGVVAPPHGGESPAGGGGWVHGNDREQRGRDGGHGQYDPANSSDAAASIPPARGATTQDVSATVGGASSSGRISAKHGGRALSGGAAGRGEGEGVALPGPDGGVEVKELDGGVLVVRRTAEEKKRSPERLNLHRRQLKSCPVIQGDSRLRLLNYQNNLISKITNLANIPSLIFLDLYNNLIDTLEGPLSAMSALRVVMVGKNKIQKISSMESLCKLDVLDLHSNVIREMQGLSTLQALRVLNLAGNRIRVVKNVSCLKSLTELNLRRNCIEEVRELDALPRLQRLFLSNNRIHSFQDCDCIFSVQSLLELSLDGNPVAGQTGVGSSYRGYILHRLSSLHHLDLKKVTAQDEPTLHSQQAPDGGGTSATTIMTTAGTATNTGSNRHRSSNGAATAAASAASTVHRSKSGKGMATVPSPTSPSTSPPSSSSSLSRHYQQQQPRSSTTSSNNNNQPLPTIQLSPGGFTPTVTTSATITTMTSNMALLPTDHPTSGSSRCSSSQSNVTNIAHKPSTGGDVPDISHTLAEQAKLAVAAEIAKAEWDAREKRALRERKEAIEAARICWENRVGGGGPSRHSKTRNRSSSAGSTRQPNPNSTDTSNSSSSSKSKIALSARESKSRGHSLGSSRSPTPPQRGRAPVAAAGISASRGGVTEGGKETGVAGRQSKDPEEAVRRGGGRRGVGYFELEQRLWDRDGKESEERGGTEGAKLSSAGGPRITLKVYGDVWRWLGDAKVCSLKHQVVEAQFFYVQVDSLGAKASAITQTFPNLSCLQLLDNGIRNLKQLEKLRPILARLSTFGLGKNPIRKFASPGAIRGWLRTQGNPTLSLLMAPTEHRVDDSGSRLVSPSLKNLLPSPLVPHNPPPPPETFSGIFPGGVIDGPGAADAGGIHDVGVGGKISGGEDVTGASSRSPPVGQGIVDSFADRPKETVEQRGSQSFISPGKASCAVDKGSSVSGSGDVFEECQRRQEFHAGGSSTGVSDDQDAGEDEAFARLKGARDRAAASSWGSVALSRVGGGSVTGAKSSSFDATSYGASSNSGKPSGGSDSSGVAVSSSWGKSADDAKLLCNGILKRVSEAQRLDHDFDHAWEAVVGRIVQDVLNRAQGSHGMGTSSDNNTCSNSSTTPRGFDSCRNGGSTTTEDHARERHSAWTRFSRPPPRASWLDD